MYDENWAEGPNTCPENKFFYSQTTPLGNQALHKDLINEYIINNDWITKSPSHYYLSIAAVRKKDLSFRLCCDYRSLNSKTQDDRHPSPCIQDAIDSLIEKNCLGSIESLSPNLSWCTKSPFDCLYYPMGPMWMDYGPIWTDECASWVPEIYGKQCLICKMNLLFHILMTPWYFQIHLISLKTFKEIFSKAEGES